MRFVLLLVLWCALLPARAQTNEEKAEALSEQADWFLDHNDHKEAIKLLEEAHKLDPITIRYPLEIARALYIGKQYLQAASEAERLLGRADATDELVQIMANSYRQLDKDIKAKAVLDSGIKRFPNSPRLQFEMGHLQLYWKQFDQSLISFERGIKADPRYTSNYYWAAMVCLKAPQQEKMWGLFYGEMYRALSNHKELSDKMSKELYEAYKSQITFPTPNSFRVNFAMPPDPDKTATWHKNNPPKPTYCTAIFEPTLGSAIGTENQINLKSLVNIRTDFLDYYYMQEFDKKYSNLVLAFQKQVADAGHFQAYNYWLLSEGDKPAFQNWRDRNPERWQAFLTWFETHRPEPTWQRYFTRF